MGKEESSSSPFRALLLAVRGTRSQSTPSQLCQDVDPSWSALLIQYHHLQANLWIDAAATPASTNLPDTSRLDASALLLYPLSSSLASPRPVCSNATRSFERRRLILDPPTDCLNLDPPTDLSPTADSASRGAYAAKGGRQGEGEGALVECETRAGEQGECR